MKRCFSSTLKKLALLVFVSLFTEHAYSQNSFGLEFGQVNQRQFGVHKLDSIVVLPSRNESINTRLLAAFFELELTKKFSIHHKLSYYKAFTSYVYFNENKEVFPGMFEKKVSGPRIRRVSLDVLPQFALIDFGKIRVNAFGGLSFSANMVLDDEEFDFRGLPGVSLVGNSFKSSQIPFTTNFVFGGSVEYSRRLVFWTKWQPSSYYSKEINIDGDHFSFKNKWSFFSFTLGYKFYSLKIKGEVD